MDGPQVPVALGLVGECVKERHGVGDAGDRSTPGKLLEVERRHSQNFTTLCPTMSMAMTTHTIFRMLYLLYNTLSEAISTAIFFIIPDNRAYYQDQCTYAQVT